jgi:hypothetical protein
LKEQKPFVIKQSTDSSLLTHYGANN